MAKILLVDDSPSSRIQLRKELEAAGHSVLEGEDGRAGLDLLSAHPDIQLVISDLNMPKLDGFGMCAELQKLGLAQKIPIFMLTSESDPALKQKGKSLGIKAWINKPYDLASLLAVIGKMMAK